MEICSSQSIFMLFYAICWGYVANVTGRWKAFNFPFFLCKICYQNTAGATEAPPDDKENIGVSQLPEGARIDVLRQPPTFMPATWRLILSVLLFNIVPILYFYVVINTLNPDCKEFGFRFIACSILPALAPFGFYRWWQGIVEGWPERFYVNIAQRDSWMPIQWWFGEPTYAAPRNWNGRQQFNQLRALQESGKEMPVLYIGDRWSGFLNFCWGTVYVAVGVFAAFQS